MLCTFCDVASFVTLDWKLLDDSSESSRLSSCTLGATLGVLLEAMLEATPIHLCSDYDSGSSHLCALTLSHLSRPFQVSPSGRFHRSLETTWRRVPGDRDRRLWVVIATVRPFYDKNRVDSAESKVPGQVQWLARVKAIERAQFDSTLDHPKVLWPYQRSMYIDLKFKFHLSHPLSLQNYTRYSLFSHPFSF